MQSNLYKAGIATLSVSLVLACFWIVNHMIQGFEFNEFTAYPTLVVIDGVIALIFEIIFLSYLFSKGYKTTLVINLFTVVTFLVLYSWVYIFYTYNVGTGYLINYVATVHFIGGIIFYLSLVFTKASERPLLKKMGVVGAVVVSVILITHVAGLNLAEGAILDVVLNINLWTSRIGELVVIFFILNFYDELKSTGTLSLQT